MLAKFKRILYGGDYNPNQWPKAIWEKDMEFFKDAHINSATINVFSWAKLQPSEEEYDFRELDEIVDMLSRENYDIVLATSTAAMPAWLEMKSGWRGLGFIDVLLSVSYLSAISIHLFPDLPDNCHIGRQPLHRIQFFSRQPSCSFMFFQYQISGYNLTPETIHG